MLSRKFDLGDRVRLLANTQDMIRVHPNQTAITYEVVRILPEERDGEPQYHLKSDVEPHMRSVVQSQLTNA